eukprot:786759-Pyramimonas_sp.AAC.1
MARRMASMVSDFLDGGRYTDTRRQVLSPRLIVAATAHPGTRSSDRTSAVPCGMRIATPPARPPAGPM